MPRILTRVGKTLSEHPTLIATALFTALTLIWNRAEVEHIHSTCSCNLPGDAEMFLWSFAWYPHALLHGQSLFSPHVIYMEGGSNLAAATSAPFAAFVMAPVTLIFGPIVSYGLAIILVPIANSLGVYWLCRYITKAPWASMLAGVTVGFGLYAQDHDAGHYSLAITFLISLMALCVLKLLAGEISRRRFTIFASILIAAQILSSTELFFTGTVLGVVVLAIYCLLAGKSGRRKVFAELPWLALPYVIAVVVTSYYLYLELKMPPAAANAGQFYPTDLLNFFIPRPSTWVLGNNFWAVTNMWANDGGGAEANSYIGVVLIAIVARYIATHWQDRRVKLLTALIPITVLWILGTRLWVSGQKTIWMPYALIEPLPGFKQVLQSRIGLYLEILCAIFLALWVSAPRGRVWLRWAVGLLAVVMVLPNLGEHYSAALGTYENPKFFATSMYKQYIPKHSTIMVLRWWGEDNFIGTWQAEDDFYYNLADNPFPPTITWFPQNEPIYQVLLRNEPKPRDAKIFRQFLVDRNVSYVVVDPKWLSLWRSTLHATGLRRIGYVGGIYLYEVPRSWRSSA